MIIYVNDRIRIELIGERHSQALFEAINSNRVHLAQWLPFVNSMVHVEHVERFVSGSMKRCADGIEFAFVIFENDLLVGRIGVYKIDNQNKIGEVGYWIISDKQGYGIVTDSCKSIIEFSFNKLLLNRLELRCGSVNYKSMAVAERLNFIQEGVLRQGELVNGKFIDLHLYSLLKEECDF